MHMQSHSNGRKPHRFLPQDIAIILFSLIVAAVLVKTGALVEILTATSESRFWGSFIAGAFFTSIFTTAPAIVALGEIAGANSVFETALIGALGAVFGDMLIFRFVRDRFSEHLVEITRHAKGWRRFRALFRTRLFRRLTFLAGGLIIASPFPDELGISLLGFSKVKFSSFILLSFAFNFLGILAIGLIARSLT